MNWNENKNIFIFDKKNPRLTSNIHQDLDTKLALLRVEQQIEAPTKSMTLL